MGKAKNPVAMLFNPKVAKNTITELAKVFGLELTEASATFVTLSPTEKLPFDDDEE